METIIVNEVNETGTIGQPGLFSNLQQIKQLVEKHGLSPEFFDNAKEHLDAVCAVLKVTPVQAALFTLLLEHSGSPDARLSGIANTLHCGKIEALRYRSDLEALELKHIIVSHDTDDDDIFNSRPSFLKNRQGQDSRVYIVPRDVVLALEAGREYHYAIYRGLSPEEFYTAADHILRAFREKELDSKQFLSEIKFLFGGNPHIQFVKKMKTGSFGFRNDMVLLDFCATLVEHEKESQPFSEIRYIFGRRSNQTDAKQDFVTGENELFKSGLIEQACDNGLADTEEYGLTNKARDIFLEDVDMKEKKEIKGKNIIHSASLAKKQLYYPPKVGSQIDDLSHLLQEENFSLIVKRLKESNMKTGFACLFSGPPGTGKTETAYQIARAVGRDIFFVDISETKSKWFGESEEKIKSLFTRYNAMVKHAERAPILLFNEADAVLCKRQEIGTERHGPAQTENAIQNILLQEIENLDGGILIATTNMASNFDAAFERRFLYKIEFEKPDLQAKAAIWKSILPQGGDMDLGALAGRFDFSGGQIENVARKATVASLIRGTPLSAVDITALCEAEQPGKEARRIGFV
jgi:DNA replication protein DnaC